MSRHEHHESRKGSSHQSLEIGGKFLKKRALMFLLKDDEVSDNKDDNKKSSIPVVSGSFMCINSFGPPYDPVK